MIFIWGLMGSGKSSTGKKLAKKLGWEFIDADLEIEADEGRSIAQIFEQDGEGYFRQVEKKWIESLDLEKTVIALGGGTPCFNDLDSKLLERGLCIWFDAPIGMLVSRILNSNSNRPLLDGYTKEEIKDKLSALLEKRRNTYQKAHLIVQINKLSIEELTGYVDLAISDK